MSWFKSFWKRLTARAPGVHVQTQGVKLTDLFGGIESSGNFTPRAQQVLALARKEAQRFRGARHLFQRSPYDTPSVYVELELEDGQTVFVSRSSIIRFNEPGQAGQQE